MFDCLDPERLAEFWTGALGYEKVVPFGNYIMLCRGGPGFPRLVLQQVPEPKAGKNRVHLDINAIDVEAEAARLEKLGGRRLDDGTRREEHGGVVVNWIVMTDPESNEFCLSDGGDGPASRL